ncbi:HindVP family restriction endonuclease [Cryobacterium sp. PH31-L1]|uniref:HindVP family restriction endonuclease n=1 Tax=Cryobacterium sp. PH31-L1 TaxID=3046199 RepID=UPI0024BAC7BE|nr:HindVP family restriction endonuclease [Cryobacterium sp. PH31-L1]MDJ0376439.1 HindVP family restriction endonuclease [Cryobacterium sp. PH31-L1]
MVAGLFGLGSSSRDFAQANSWGKNVFTNSLPIALARYMDSEGLDPVLISAYETSAGRIATRQTLTPLSQILNVEPDKARFLFETIYSRHIPFSKDAPEKSDVVIAATDGSHRRALEIKLTTVPDSSSAEKPHDQQSCEIVSRPLMIEQLAVTICASFGLKRRRILNELLNEFISHPAQMPWPDEPKMLARLPEILNAVEQVIRRGLELQTPMVLHPIWRTVGKTPVLEDDCFDVFVWTDLAWSQLLLDSSRTIRDEISRPQRSIIWLVKMLWDYSTQGSFDRANTFESITYNKQTDKAASFAGNKTIVHLRGQYLSSPRIPASALSNIILGDGVKFLAPERRLDAAIFIQVIRDSVKPSAALGGPVE